MRKPFFAESPEQSLARAFAEHIVSWARQTRELDDSVAAMLKKAAWHVSMAVSSGDSCLLLDELDENGAETDIGIIRQKLFDSGIVGTPDQPGNRPLVLDGENRLYLHRYFEYEKVLAECLFRMCQPREIDAKSLRPLLDSLFSQKRGDKTPDWQKIAAALALRQSLLIISGGPGTGKTTTVASLLACILETSPDNRIMLAAPTGKAAKRMLDSISERMDLFPMHMHPAIPKDAFTIHRLLGITDDLAKARYHKDNPLPCDTLVVDEASMLDLALASTLFAALPENARVILLGDKDQLAAVEAGAVFAELSSRFILSDTCRHDLKELTGFRLTESDMPETANDDSAAPLGDSVVWLMKNYRFPETSGIGRLAACIRDKRITEAVRFLRDKKDPLVRWLDMDDPSVASGFEKILSGQFDAYFNVVRENAADVRLVFDVFNRSRILCAVREGPYGVNAVNRLLANAIANRQTVGKQAAKSAHMKWFAGQPIMVRRNDYVLKLFNGDVGIVLPDATGNLSVYFPDENGSFRPVPPSRIGEAETSFAMTVHQSQGSEFDSILLLLPREPSRVLSRELIYTGITRARSKISIASRMPVLLDSLEHDSARRSGLVKRILDIRSCRESKQ